MICDLDGKMKVYHGETARNLSMRSKEHVSLYEKKSDKSFMYNHAVKEHQEHIHDVKFKWNVLRKFKKPLQRQIFEAKHIDKKSEEQNLNSKEEFNGQTLKIIKVTVKRKALHCDTCGKEFYFQNILNDHNTKFHDRFNCEFCDYTSFGRRDLIEHKQNTHINLYKQVQRV